MPPDQAGSAGRVRQSNGVEVRSNGTAEQIQVVAAFEKADHPPVRILLGESQDVLCHFCEVRIFQQRFPSGSSR